MKELSDFGEIVSRLLVWFGGYERWILHLVTVLIVTLGVVLLLDNKTPESPRYLPNNAGARMNLISNRLAALLTYPYGFLIPGFCLYISKNASFVNAVLVMLMALHYLQRTFIYGVFIKGNSKIPLHVLKMSALFCALNGYVIGRYHTEYAVYTGNWVRDPRFISGVIVFFTGMAINIHSDHILRNLRKPGESGYKIPRGGLFEYVTGANYFGEIVEWTGFCMACWTLHSLAFAFFTASYIGLIKAFAHHRWYLEKFEDYPKNRKVVIPFLL